MEVYSQQAAWTALLAYGLAKAFYSILNAHSESIFSLRFDSAGKRLLTGSYDKCVSVWDVRTGSIQCRTYIIQVKRPLQESCSISLKPIQHKSLTLIGKLVSARAHSNSDCISNSSIG